MSGRARRSRSMSSSSGLCAGGLGVEGIFRARIEVRVSDRGGAAGYGAARGGGTVAVPVGATSLRLITNEGGMRRGARLYVALD